MPAPPCPKRKFSPTNTARAPRWSDSTALQKAAGRQPGELPVERDDHQLFQAQPFEQFGLALERRQHRRGSPPVEHSVRMRIEGHRGRRGPRGPRGLDRLAQDLLMPAMHAVEHADGHHPAGARGIGNLVSAR